MADQGKIEKDRERYERAAHRVQTAISFMPLGEGHMTPKQIRTGVDMQKSDLGGMATLLIEKGIFTEEEYASAMADAAEREADGYEALLMTRFGISITTQ